MWRNLSFKAVAAAEAEPLNTSAFAALMESFAPVSGRLAVAVSGGPDSMALAWYVRNWTMAPGELKAFIVDHVLRPTSAAEAAATQLQLELIGIKAEILRWEHPPITSRLHVQARKARYQLLTDACRRYNITDLLLGHQQDDQAETILMRLAKGSGIDGLAGIAMENTINGVRLLRPFLNVPKERLVAACHAAHLTYITDSSNLSDKFARGRLRRVMPLLAEEGLTVERLVDLAARAADAKTTLDYYTMEFLRSSSRRDVADVLRVDLDALRATQPAIAQRAVQSCLQHFSAEDYPPERASLLPLIDGLKATDDMTPRTLHGCLVSKTGTDAIFMREESAITDAFEILPGETRVWDNRWRVSLPKNESSTTYIVRPLGNPPHEAVDKFAPRLRHDVPQGRARASLPALWDGEKLAGIPAFSGETACHMELAEPWPPQNI